MTKTTTTGTCIVCGGDTTHRDAAGFHHPIAEMATCDARRDAAAAAQFEIDRAAHRAHCTR